jgi:predicted  nucleic acid-binding Zn-ribbon protein
MALERRLSPEEKELQAKQAELDALIDRLAQKELDLETLHAEINTFFLAYNAAVLPKVAEARELMARIAHAIYILDPRDDTQNESQDAREAADQSEKDRQEQFGASGQNEPVQPESFKPSPELRSIYLDLVKKAHPDLGKDDEDRRRRNDFMVRVNQAYQDGDANALQALADEWALGGDPAEGESIGDRLVRLIRQISDVRNRLATMDSEIENVKNSDDYLLVDQAEQARSQGRDLTSEHVARTEEHIAELKSQISDIKDRLTGIYDV